MIIDIGHQKVTEMPDDGPPNTVMSYPFNDRFRLDVA